MTSNPQTIFMTKMIREGYEAADVTMWQSLLQKAKTDFACHEFVFLLLDMARHNKVNVLDIVKTGRVCSEQKTINQPFIDAILNAVASDDEGESKPRVLDLTCDESSLSGSYEEEEKGFYDDIDDNPTSAEAYEIDGFVVADDDDVDDKPKKRLLKRKLVFDSPTSSPVVAEYSGQDVPG